MNTQNKRELKESNQEKKFWRKWYWALFLWLLILIFLFSWFTKYYS